LQTAGSESSQISANIFEKFSWYHQHWVKRKSLVFPRLNETEMAAFLGIQRVRMQWARREGIVERDANGLYHPEVVTRAWLAYERSPRARGRKRGSEFERQRARLTKAKAEAAERKLALLDHALVGTDDIVERLKVVCLRIRNKLLTAVPRIARACYSAPSVGEAVSAARSEFDLVISELSALQEDGIHAEFEVVSDAESAERSTAG
jgi:phage terminase Nu1 subunit (DNA packaging protein)